MYALSRDTSKSFSRTLLIRPRSAGSEWPWCLDLVIVAGSSGSSKIEPNEQPPKLLMALEMKEILGGSKGLSSFGV